MKIALYTLTNEPEYLAEWLEHHRKYGFDHFFVYLDSSMKIDENVTIPADLDITYKAWDCKNSPQGQMRAQEDCCKNNQDYDYILMIDSDEYLATHSSLSIKEVISNIQTSCGNFDALGIYWLFYGSNPPFETRQPIENYKQWCENGHIKSLVNPKKVLKYPDPHKAILSLGSRYIDELGRNITSPIGEHTSRYIWIKHIWTRSKSEWETKVNRKGWYQFYNRKMEEFDSYNKNCVNSD